MLTSNCGVVSGGDIVNRVPNRCCLKFDVRSTSLKEINLFLNLINKEIKKLEKEYKTEIKIKKTLEQYKADCNTVTKSGTKKSRQAWYELVIQNNVKVDLIEKKES